MFKSRLWIKAFLLILIIVGLCSLAIALYSIPLTWKITYAMEKKFATSMLDRVTDLVKAKYQEIEDYQKFAIASKKQELRNIISIVEGYVASEYDAAFRGNIAEKEAQKKVIEKVRRLRYGSNDYVFITDYNSVLVAHPDDNLQGKDFSTVKDAYGNLIVPPMVEIALSKGEGFHSYWWNRLNETEPAEKLSYSRLFAPWRWAYGTGVYIDDIKEEMDRKKDRLVQQLREMMRKIIIGKTGYMYIFDSKLNMIIHPNKKLEGTLFGPIKNPLTGRSLAKELVKSAHQEDNTLVYQWDRPSDPGHYVYDKISWVVYFKDFDWYIGSSVYTRELYDSSKRLANRIAWITFFVFAISIALGSFFLIKLLRPIERLSRVALKVQQGDLNVRSGIRRDDEIGILAREFDNMVDNLKDHVETLDAKVQEKTQELKENYDKLEYANRQIVDSIQYAQTIQNAILPKDEEVSPHLRDYFILWKPKDIIGGDLFWFDAKRDGFLIAVMDCTGHGVPGAIMTMIATMGLSWVVHDLGNKDPSRILTELNTVIRNALSQNTAESLSGDGLDIGICAVDAGYNTLTFSGARIDLYCAKGKEISRMDGDRQSIGYHSSGKNIPFTAHRIPLAADMRFYLTTDGLTDQIGGEQGFPFGRRRFVEFLSDHHLKPFNDQKALLDKGLTAYQGREDQRDDITVFGFKI